MSIEGTLLSTDYTVGGGAVTVAEILNATQKATQDWSFNAKDMVDGDIIRIKVFTMANSSDVLTVVVDQVFSFSDISNAPMITSFPSVLEVGLSYRITFEQTAGVVHDWEWGVSDVPIQ